MASFTISNSKHSILLLVSLYEDDRRNVEKVLLFLLTERENQDDSSLPRKLSFIRYCHLLLQKV
jgi:hypothetical protein